MSEMRVTSGKGVHFTFENGATISIQIGGGNYGDNYDFPIGEITYSKPLPPSTSAEIAAWATGGDMATIDGDTVAGYVKMDQVFDAMEMIRSLPDPATKESVEKVLSEWSMKHA